MSVFNISQYAPHILAALCFVGMIGLSRPTVSRPNTWHMTLFIVLAFSTLNALMAPIYSYFMSVDRLIELGGNPNIQDSHAYKVWMTGYASIYGFQGLLDLATFALVRRFSQRGRKKIAVLMGFFIIVHALTILDITEYYLDDYSLGVFSQLLTISDSVYSNYVYLILLLNTLQFYFLFGGCSGWSRDNAASNLRAFYSPSSASSWVRTTLNLGRFKRNEKRKTS